MNPTTDIHTAEWLHEHTSEALDRVAGGGGPMVITRGGAAAVVVVDMAEFAGLRESLTMMRLLEFGRAEIAAGRSHTVDELERDMKALLADRA